MTSLLVLATLCAGASLETPWLGRGSEFANPDYTPIDELTVTRSADGHTLAGSFLISKVWSSTTGWGTHGEPRAYFSEFDQTSLFLNNAWDNAGLTVAFPSKSGTKVSFTVKRAQPFPATGWLMFTLQGHEHGRGAHPETQFFAARYPARISAFDTKALQKWSSTSDPQPGGNIIPITVHAPVRATTPPPVRRIRNWASMLNVANIYTFAHKSNPAVGPGWMAFAASDSYDVPNVIKFPEPAYACYAAEARRAFRYQTFGGVWDVGAGVIRTRAESEPTPTPRK